jgi:hypothetical protein
MKYVTNYLKLIVPSLCILLLVGACKKDKNAQTSIIGTWVTSHNYEKGEVSNQTYFFKSDSSVQITRTIIDSASGKLLGYQYLSNGKFHLSNNHLNLYELVSSLYTGGNPYYTSIDKLSPYAETAQSYTVNISADYNSFNFVYPPCPAYANCIGLQIYKRQ